MRRNEPARSNERTRAPGRGRIGQRGLTLLEVMIALMILAIAMAGVYAMMLSSLQLSHTTRETNLAVFDLTAALEAVRSTPFAEITTEYPDGAEVPEYAGLHLSEERIVIEYEDPDDDPLIIAGEITWRDHHGRGERSIRMCTARTR